ncbi:hypothetical protein SS1G_08237 [Sclerotinia sclerotiorum 1980 UF-70]|uniref:Uncharacterized protein n=1 Tax=Sclerotinia sclerotiorum (strain ATCC 18683 / 1980 / Ss-1) TaxID=665079 RepID=A7ESD2_SCLS1|nr:hypothetical protein SS1G_08237 [Sclerotinia sclerotiorum 1980 UF-70]EDN92374.1 hypothetical protein SS1G_08237 [Sclerotinia sclerotiorum 1980 UF-70]
MPQKYSISPDMDESIPDTSTAPTTPDDSLTFSPIIQPLSLDDGITLGNSPVNEIAAHHVPQNDLEVVALGGILKSLMFLAEKLGIA